jgi:hypothetical protein
MEQLRAAELQAFKPGATSPFLTLTDSLQSVSATESAQDVIDSASITLESTGRPLSGERITSGDRLEFRTRLADEQSLTTRSVLLARDITDELTAGGGVRNIDIEATDFVFTVLSFRTSDGSFEAVDAGDVANSLIAEDCPEIGRSQIETVGRDVTLTVNGRKTLDIVSQDLAPVGDALVAQDGTDLVFRPLEDVSSKFSLVPDDLHTPIGVQRIDDELINRVRVDGGTDSALDDEQPTQSATVRVTDSSRQTFQIDSRKSEIDSVEIFTVKDTTASEGLIVRLQAARNGSAVDPTDTESDVARRELAPDFIADNGFTEFLLPAHDLAPAEDPFVIIEGAGSTGHEIKTDGSTPPTPTFRAFFPFPLLARATAGDSVTEFRRRELRRRDDQLSSEQAVQDTTQSLLRHRTEPKRRVSAAAATPRAHRLQPGEAVDMSAIPVDDVTGDYLVTERQTAFDGVRLDTELTFEDATTI